MAGLQSLVREMNLNPKILNMQGAFETISSRYVQVHGVELGERSHIQHRQMLLDELRRFFEKELAFVVSPPNGCLNAKIRAITGEDDLMNDLGLSEASTSPETKLNETMKDALLEMLSTWGRQKWVQLTFNDLLAQFNRNSTGIYRKSCILPFTKPLVDARVAVIESETIRFDVQGVARILRKIK